MNAKTIIAAAALALIGSATFADEVRDYPTPSTLTRAEVKAELARAQANGEIAPQSESYGDVQPTVFAQRTGKDSIQASGNTAGLKRVEVKRDLSRAQPDERTRLLAASYGLVLPAPNGVQTR